MREALSVLCVAGAHAPDSAREAISRTADAFAHDVHQVVRERPRPPPLRATDFTRGVPRLAVVEVQQSDGAQTGPIVVTLRPNPAACADSGGPQIFLNAVACEWDPTIEAYRPCTSSGARLPGSATLLAIRSGFS